MDEQQVLNVTKIAQNVWLLNTSEGIVGHEPYSLGMTYVPWHIYQETSKPCNWSLYVSAFQ